jgi:iron-sulfur cluster assembly accessory protein
LFSHWFCFFNVYLRYFGCRVFDKDGSKVVIDNISLDLIRGATIDYEQELIRNAFAVVNNPQSESACGCGSSFAVKAFTSNPAND